jgi:hypothetical protein
MHENAAYYATELTSDEPGVTGAPLVDDDQLETIWAAPGELQLDTNEGFTPDGAPFDDRFTTAILYFPVLTEGHVQIAVDSPTDQYIGYGLVAPNGVLAATGQSDASIGFDLDDTGTWLCQLFKDSGTSGLVTLTTVFSGGLTITPAPEANAWVRFA